MRYTLKLNSEQAQVLVNALDLYARIGIGQFEEVVQVYDYDLKLQGSTRSTLHSLLMVAKELVGHHPSSSFGIHNKLVHDIFRVAYDIKQVVRNRLEWDRNTERTVNFQPPSPISAQPLVQIEGDK